MNIHKKHIRILAFVSIAIAAFLAGVFWGRSIGFRQCFDLVLEHPEAESVQRMVAALKFIRGSKSEEAIPLLESQLDDSISAFGGYVKDRPQSEWNTNVVRALKSAKAYRVSYPPTAVHAPILKPSVEEVLSTVDSKRVTE